jgi:hypothetical protein
MSNVPDEQVTTCVFSEAQPPRYRQWWSTHNQSRAFCDSEFRPLPEIEKPYILISREDAKALAAFDVRKWRRLVDPPINREPTEEFRMAVSRLRKQLHPHPKGDSRG